MNADIPDIGGYLDDLLAADAEAVPDDDARESMADAVMLTAAGNAMDEAASLFSIDAPSAESDGMAIPDATDFLASLLDADSPLPMGNSELSIIVDDSGAIDPGWLAETPAIALPVPEPSSAWACVDGAPNDVAPMHDEAITRQGFRIGKLHLMVPFHEASELSEMRTVYRLPNCAQWFRGLVNLHGKLIPVFDLGLLYEGSPSSHAASMLLVLNPAEPAAVIVDGITERLKLSADQCVAAPELPPPLAENIVGAYLQNEQLWLDFNVAGALASISASLSA